MDAAPMNTLNAPLGVMIFTLGGLAGAVFYLPFKKVNGWAWERYRKNDQAFAGDRTAFVDRLSHSRGLCGFIVFVGASRAAIGRK